MLPLFREAGVPLYGLLHQHHGQRALNEFKSYFDGDLFLDTEKRFFGPVERRLGIMGLLRVSAYTKIYKAKQKGVEGNLKGDGTLLGAVYLIGPGDTGILFEHREQEFGDHHNSTALKEALAQLVKTKKSF